MYSRLLAPPVRQSWLLFGPRGTGKTAWVSQALPRALTFDLLDARVYTGLLAKPSLLAESIPQSYTGWVVIDEVQRAPALLDEVHWLIEKRGLRFLLTGSSARKLRREGVNLLAGRALTRFMHPLTAKELGSDFVSARRSVARGTDPQSCRLQSLPGSGEFLTSSSTQHDGDRA